MAEERGMVVKIEGRSCIAVTPEGEFREVPLPRGVDIRAGQEISLAGRNKVAPYLRYFMVAASFLIFFLTGQFYVSRAQLAAAYLTMDINPSIELAVSNKGKVVSYSGLNSDGDKILSEVSVKGCDLDQAVGIIVTQAIADNYLTKTDDNIILTTLTVKEDSDPVVDLEFVYKAIKSSMDSGGVVSEVIIETVKPEMRQEAEESGISTGRLLLHKKTVEKSLPVSVSEIGAMKLDKIEKDNKVSIVNLIGEGSGDVRIYNLDKGEGAGIVKQGIYAERRNSNIKIKTRPDKNRDNETSKNHDKNENNNENNNKNENKNENKNSSHQNNSKK